MEFTTKDFETRKIISFRTEVSSKNPSNFDHNYNGIFDLKSKKKYKSLSYFSIYLSIVIFRNEPCLISQAAGHSGKHHRQSFKPRFLAFITKLFIFTTFH